MKSYRYPILTVGFFAVALLLVSVDASAQRGRYHRGPRGYYRPHYAPSRMYVSSRPFISVQFGGNPYRYQHGYFYRPYGSGFRVVMPPVGIRISTLPPGYRRVYVGPDPYYYYNGIYYRSPDQREYEVVAPPLGATVNELPPGAKVAVIDGQKYYELDGTYYEERINDQDELEYTVVGTDGVLNTDGLPEYDGPQVGDRFDTLPPDSKAVVIRGEKLYSTPSGFYYKEVMEDNKIVYEIVGK